MGFLVSQAVEVGEAAEGPGNGSAELIAIQSPGSDREGNKGGGSETESQAALQWLTRLTARRGTGRQTAGLEWAPSACCR
jgi:hypothetical protein